MERLVQQNAPVVVIVGPTAVGKTDCAIKVAKAIGGEVISADSRYLYQGMDIGTAKPDEKTMAGIPHYLIDVAKPDESWSLARVQQEVKKRIGEIHLRNHVPILVGGTGQYIRAIIEGWSPPPVVPDEAMRRALEDWLKGCSPERIREILRLLDPKSAERIDPRNLRRVVRAIEVIYKTGIPFSHQRGGEKPPYQFILIGLILPRDVLYSRVDRRIDEMIATGLVEEVKQLLDAGYSPDLPSFGAIGYREIAQYLLGKLSLEDAKQMMRKKTRVLIRRQANWFRLEDERYQWFEAVNGYEERIIRFIWEQLDSAKGNV